MTTGVSGAAAVMALDACERYGLAVAKLSGYTQEKIQAASPYKMEISNFVDLALIVPEIGGDEAHRVAIDAVMKDRNTDYVILNLMAQDFPHPCTPKLQVLFDLASKYRKPFAVCIFGPEEAVKRDSELLEAGGILVYPSPERVIRFFSALSQYGKFRRENR